MRLISCYAAGYGSLKNNVLSFQKGLNPYQGENGTGKTTLTSFIKAMFYGLETQKKNGKFSEREHYCPFDGGVFGGNVVFEHNGATYRIERSFDKKSESKDTVNVYKNDRRTDEFNGLDLGVTFFGVDKGSFERTVFVTADDVNVSATSDIKTKLGAAIQGGDGDTFYNADYEDKTEQ